MIVESQPCMSPLFLFYDDTLHSREGAARKFDPHIGYLLSYLTLFYTAIFKPDWVITRTLFFLHPRSPSSAMPAVASTTLLLK